MHTLSGMGNHRLHHDLLHGASGQRRTRRTTNSDQVILIDCQIQCSDYEETLVWMLQRVHEDTGRSAPSG
jgi:hypothetical protein